MSSLFDDGCGCGNTDPANRTKCKGCVCELLNQLANQQVSSLCALGRAPEVLLVNKGTNTPVALGGTTTPTVFTLAKFDPNTCCAVFTYLETTADGTITRTYVTDCRALAGVTCLSNV